MVVRALVGSSLLLALTACGDDLSPRGDLDPDVPPVTEGDWTRLTVATTWQWQLTGAVNTTYDVDLYDIDLFDSSAEQIAALQSAGRVVICYFSAGSSEDWRSDFKEFRDTDMGERLDGWEGERWLDVRSANVHRIMRARLDLAVTKGCDGVEPDNVDGFDNDTGFELKAIDQLAFNRFLGNEAHTRSLTVGLKNEGAQASELVDYFDFSLNEECHEYHECGDLMTFLDAGRPIFNAEYADNETAAQSLATSLCPQARAENFRTIVFPWDLDDSFRFACDELP